MSQNYLKKSKEKLITATRNSTANIRINRITIIRKQKREEKQLKGVNNNYINGKTQDLYKKLKLDHTNK